MIVLRLPEIGEGRGADRKAEIIRQQLLGEERKQMRAETKTIPVSLLKIRAAPPPAPLARFLSSRGSALGAPKHGLHEARWGACPRNGGSCHRSGGRWAFFFASLAHAAAGDSSYLGFYPTLSRIGVLGAIY